MQRRTKHIVEVHRIEVLFQDWLNTCFWEPDHVAGKFDGIAECVVDLLTLSVRKPYR